MFDPTAFDNMKVVIEGALYDLDIAGSIVICDRNDLINMAKMSRQFNIYFQLPETGTNPAIAKFEMEASLANLASELLPGAPENLAGCHLKLKFILECQSNFNEYQGIESIFRDIWGPERKITHLERSNPFAPEGQKTIVTIIDFERIIGEEQMDDLVSMTEFMVETLLKLDQL